jgi:thiamine kinase-like enzyme
MTTDLTAQIYQYLTTAPGSPFAQQEVEMLAHLEGDANLLWRVQAGSQASAPQAVVKLFLDAGQARSRRQFDGQQIFAPLGLAPQPIWADRYPYGLSRQLIVYRWSDGEAIAPDDPSALWAWAEAIGSLHATPTEDVRRFSPHPLNLDFYWRIEQGSIAQIHQWLAPSGLALAARFQRMVNAAETLVQNNLPLWAAAPPTPIHGDLTRQHTLVERGQVILLDWEMFGLGDPALDVARLLQREAQTLTTGQIESWLERYLQVIDQPAMDQRIDLFRRLLEIHNVFYLFVGLQQNTRNGMDSDLRDALPFLQDALSAAFDRAEVALGLPTPVNSQPLVDDFIAWLAESTPIAP